MKARDLLSLIGEANKKYKMSKTYQVVTRESSKTGDVAEDGFEYEDKVFDSLWDIASELRDNGATEDFGNGSFGNEDEDVDYRTGEVTTYAFHPDVSNSEYKEIKRLLKLSDRDFREEDPDNT